MLPDVATHGDFSLPEMTLGYPARAVIGQSHVYDMNPMDM